MFGQLQGTGLASKTYDFRLHFWDRFLGSFLNASSNKVTTSRAAPRPQSFRLFVGLVCAPILATRFCFPCSSSCFRVALRTPKLDQCTV